MARLRLTLRMKQTQSTNALGEILAPYVRQVEGDLERWLVEPGVPPSLAEGMAYCVLDGGKRVRPALVLISAEAGGGDAADELARRAAVAVELVHCYSLVHDDLPAMDDDALRRGRPTAHVQFGEAMAILIGDALLTRAFGLLGEAKGLQRPEAVGALGAELAGGAGPAGMIAGQVADMGLCEIPDGLAGLRYIHLHKTATLIRAATTMGAICAQAPPKLRSALRRFGEALGLAFQLTDDLLDVTGDAGEIGKATGKDAQAGKRTYAQVLGIAASEDLGRELTKSALETLRPLGERGRKLHRLAELLLARTN